MASCTPAPGTLCNSTMPLSEGLMGVFGGGWVFWGWMGVLGGGWMFWGWMGVLGGGWMFLGGGWVFWGLMGVYLFGGG